MSESLHFVSERDPQVIRRWPTRRSKTWVLRFLRAARTDNNIAAVIAVGSSVRPRVSSVDVDLVVLAKDVTKLEGKPPIEVDLRAYPVNQVDALISSSSDLLGWAVVYGEVLLQKEGVWSRIKRKWDGRVPLPSEDTARKRANEALRRFNEMVEIGDYDAAYEQALAYLTHVARAQLIKSHIYPASRPELADQLRKVHCSGLADSLQKVVTHAVNNEGELVALVKSIRSH